MVSFPVTCDHRHDCHISPVQLFSPGELLQFMKIAPPSPLHDSLLEGEKEHGMPHALPSSAVGGCEVIEYQFSQASLLPW